MLRLIACVFIIAFVGVILGCCPLVSSTDSARADPADAAEKPARGEPPPAPKDAPARKTAKRPADLIAGLPENARPANTGDTIRIDRANDWLKQTAPGTKIVWDCAVSDVSLRRMDGRFYTVTIHQTVEGFKINGVGFSASMNGGTIRLSDILDDVADILTPLKGKTVTVTALVESASISGGTLQVSCTSFVVGKVATGLAAMLEKLGTGSAADRKAILPVAARHAVPVRNAELLAAFAIHLKDKDAAVRIAAAHAVLMLDPAHKDALAALPASVTLGGRFSRLAAVVYTPEVEEEYKSLLKDGIYLSGKYGVYEQYKGYTNIPAGHWVFIPPYWYIWSKDSEEKN